MPDNPSSLSTIIHDLSDVLERLASLIEAQTKLDDEHHIQKLSVVKKHLKTVTDATRKEVNERLKAQIRSKYKKQYLLNWLKSKKITPTVYHEDLKADSLLGEVAEYLADHYDYLKDFYKLLKSRLNVKTNFTYHVPHSNAKALTQWCAMLRKYDLIDGYEQRGSELFIDISEMEKAFAFINGHWLEILMRAKITNWIIDHINEIQNFDVLSQVQIIKDDGRKSELDILIMVNNQVWWFECKSGSFSDYYELFKEHKTLMGLPSNRCALVIPTYNETLFKNITQRSKMTPLVAEDIDIMLHDFLKP